MEHPDEKLKFQIERIAFFSDAVIAIAMTLLVIEIKAPKIHPGTTVDQQIKQLTALIPEFVSFIISFSIIISQWIKHHKMFGGLIDYDRRLILLNALFLFVIALIPFSTSYFSLNNDGRFYLPYVVYGLTLFFLTFLNFLLFRHITHHSKALYDRSMSHTQVKWQSAEYLLFPTVILLSLIIGYFNFDFALTAYIVVFLLGYLYIRKRKKRAGITVAQ